MRRRRTCTCQVNELLQHRVRCTCMDNAYISHANRGLYQVGEGCLAVGGKEDQDSLPPRLAACCLNGTVERASTCHGTCQWRESSTCQWREAREQQMSVEREQHMSRQSRERAHVTAHARSHVTVTHGDGGMIETGDAETSPHETGEDMFEGVGIAKAVAL